MTAESDTAAAASQTEEAQELATNDVGADEQPPLGDDAPLAADVALPANVAMPENDPDFAEVDDQPAPEAIPPSGHELAVARMKAHIRDVLDAQPFRGHAVHKDDLLAVIDALIDGPDA